MAEDDWETVSEKGEENGIEKSKEKDYNDDKMYSYKHWHSDLTKKQMLELADRVRADVKTSENAITDTSNWLFTEIDGMPVFAIYSTSDMENPTILYESKGEQGKYEKALLQEVLERIKHGKSVDSKSRDISIVLSGSWVRDVSGIGNGFGIVGSNSDVRNATILQKSSKRKPSGAFKSVIENLFKTEERGRGNLSYSFSEKSGSVTTDSEGKIFLMDRKNTLRSLKL